MRRHWVTRAFGLLLSAWFSLSTGNMAIARVCPMHDGVLASAAPHAMAHQMAGAAGQHGDDAPAPQGRHQCNCIVCCVSNGGVAQAPAAPGVESPAIPIVAVAAFPATLALPVPAAEYARPFPTGPPRA